MLKVTVFIVSIILFIGCNSQHNTTPKNEKPKWLFDPYIDGDNVAAVGCSQIHFKGIEAQKNLAISRAIDRIATQNSVIVENITMRQRVTTNNNQRGNSSSTSSSLHTVNKVKISTIIKDIYTKENGEICIWVVQR
ncbi:MAG: hypothetical protein WA945_03480 [Arcobacteraceae bacterium]